MKVGNPVFLCVFHNYIFIHSDSFSFDLISNIWSNMPYKSAYAHATVTFPSTENTFPRYTFILWRKKISPKFEQWNR